MRKTETIFVFKMFLALCTIFFVEIVTIQSEPVAIIFSGNKDNFKTYTKSIEYYFTNEQPRNFILGHHTSNRRAHFAAVLDHIEPLVIFGGGFNENQEVRNDTILFNPFIVEQPKFGPNLMSARAFPAYAVMEFYGLLICGGQTYKGKISKTCEHYDQAQSRFVPAPEMPRAVTAGNMVSYKGKAYIIGGIEKSDVAIKDVIMLDLQMSNAKWKKMTPMPVAKRFAQGAVIGNIIYVCGGLVPNKNPPFCQAYNIEHNKWNEIKEQPFKGKYYSHTMLAIEGNLYIFGGKLGNDLNRRVFSYDPKKNKWKEAQKTVEAIANSAGVVLQLPPPGFS